MKYIIQKDGAFNFYHPGTGCASAEALTLAEVEAIVKREFGVDGLWLLPELLCRARSKGCSSIVPYDDLKSVVSRNAEDLDYDTFIAKYLTLHLSNRYGDIPTGALVTFEVENANQWSGSNEGVLYHDGVDFAIATAKGIVTIGKGYDAYLQSVKPLPLKSKEQEAIEKEVAKLESRVAELVTQADKLRGHIAAHEFIQAAQAANDLGVRCRDANAWANRIADAL